jgi:hypothetical protein
MKKILQYKVLKPFFTAKEGDILTWHEESQNYVFDWDSYSDNNDTRDDNFYYSESRRTIISKYYAECLDLRGYLEPYSTELETKEVCDCDDSVDNKEHKHHTFAALNIHKHRKYRKILMDADYANFPTNRRIIDFAETITGPIAEKIDYYQKALQLNDEDLNNANVEPCVHLERKTVYTNLVAQLRGLWYSIHNNLEEHNLGLHNK